MPEDAARWLGELHCYDKETGENLDGFENWGFTIYRTFYDPSTDSQWQRLLDKIRTKAHAAILAICETTTEHPDFQQLWSLFRLDARSDPATLDGLSSEQLQQHYKDNLGGAPMHADHNIRRVFLFADEEILSNTESSFVKAVKADFDVENHSCPFRMRGKDVPYYFGWMVIETEHVVPLWKELEIFDMDRIAPAIGWGGSKVWEGAEWL